MNNVPAISIARGEVAPDNFEVFWEDISDPSKPYFERIKYYDKGLSQWRQLNLKPSELLQEIKKVDVNDSGLNANFLQGKTLAEVLDLASGGSGIVSLAENRILVGNSEGVAEGQELSGDATIDATGELLLVDTAVVSGSYNIASITVDSKGRITSASNYTLLESDIPALAISKITGLQGVLDTKVDATDVANAIAEPRTDITFIPKTEPTYEESKLWYDSGTNSLSYYDNISGTSIQIGKETVFSVRNNTGLQINNGQVVYISGATGQNPTVALAQSNVIATSQTIGVATHDIPNNTTGKITVQGLVNGINTSSFVDGDLLYVSSTVAGGLTATPPPSPDNVCLVGYVAYAHTTNGKILISPKHVLANNNSLGTDQTSPPTENAVKNYVDSAVGSAPNLYTQNGSIPATTNREVTIPADSSLDLLGRVGIGKTPDTSAILDLSVNDKGVLLPLVNNAEMIAISSPADYLKVFNTEEKGEYFYNPSITAWDRLTKNLENSDLALTENRTVDLNGNDLKFDSSSSYLAEPFKFETYPFGGTGTNPYLKIKGYGEVEILGTSNDLFTVKNISSNPILKVNSLGLSVAGNLSATSSYFKFQTTSSAMQFFWNGGSTLLHEIQTGVGFPEKVRFNILGGTRQFIVGNSTRLNTETISLQGETTISDQFVQHVSTTPTVDGDLIDNSLSFSINGTDELQGRYKDNLGVVRDLKFPSESGLFSVNNSSGVPTYYADLQTAVTNAGDGGVVNIHSSFSQSTSVLIPSGWEVTINGNGNTITHTSNTGSNYILFASSSASYDILYLNNLKIISNGTSSSIYSSSIFGYNGNSISEVICSSDTYIYALNNNIKDFGIIRGGILEAVNQNVNFSASVFDSTIKTKFTRGNLTNCRITVNTGGNIGGNGKIEKCNVYGNADTNTLIFTVNMEETNVYCSSGVNSAVFIDNGGDLEEYQVRNCNIYHYGTGRGLNATYGKARDCYVYSEGGNAVYFQNTPTVGGYHALNIVCETNSTNNNAFYRLNNGPEFRMKNITATNLNSANTQPAIDIRVTGTHILTMEDCTANVNNASVDNVQLTGTPSTGGAYIYNLKMSKIGQGLNLGSVPLLNINTLNSYGNGQIG